jgi:hypothetical protein
MPTKLSIGGNIGVPVGPGTTVREGVAKAVGVSVVVGTENVGREIGVFVAVGLGVSANAVLTVAMAVCMISSSLSVGVDRELLQEASIPAVNKGINSVLPKMFIFHFPLKFVSWFSDSGLNK